MGIGVYFVRNDRCMKIIQKIIKNDSLITTERDVMQLNENNVKNFFNAILV